MVYIVEDDEDIRGIVDYALRQAGFEPMGFEDAEGFFHTLAHAPSNEQPSLVLLDIMLPGDDGLAILKRLRKSSKTKALPVIMLTAKGSEFDKVVGLDNGADDYLTKPFGVMELISRVNAVLRRGAPPETRRNLNYGGIYMDAARRAVTADDAHVQLTFKEYELLHYLLLNAGLVLGRDRIMESVWGYDFEGESRTLDMHIRSLRQKLGAAGEHIKTVRNVGYRLGE
ncbi:MAG: response regulator transcription factor [Clostridiales bacterium]|jgi:two-component system alkaline phosphatase synthesis response regulator PhoP|nr:response regulator transcription factor [Clostridiales bacterium]